MPKVFSFLKRGEQYFKTYQEAVGYLEKSFARYEKYFREEKPAIDLKVAENVHRMGLNIYYNEYKNNFDYHKSLGLKVIY